MDTHILLMEDSSLLTPQRAQLAAENGAIPLPPSPSPLRRSPRFSSPLPGPILPSVVEAVDNGENDDLESRPVTPDNDQANDGAWQTPVCNFCLPTSHPEPSSVLASRIMRSQSNPSPPPQSPDDARSSENTTPLPTTADVLEQPSPMPTLRVSPPPDPDIHHPVPLRVQDLKLYPERASSTEEESETRAASSSASPAHEMATSFDFTTPSLAPSPAPSQPSEPTPLQPKSHRDEPDTTDEEADVADSLIPNSPMPSSSKLPLPPDAESQTSVRRSTRPRRSLVPTPARLEPTPSPNKKGKGKATPDCEATPRPVYGSPRRDVSPSRSQYKDMTRPFRRQLDSLSPGAHGLLDNLPVTLSAVNHLDPTRPSPFFCLPSSESIAGPQRMPFRSPIRSPGPKRGASTTSSFALNVRDDPIQSPARRVPIEEAIANGRRSPSKPLNSDIFSLNIPASDTPARRVPAANLSAPRGNLKPPAFDKQAPVSSPSRSRSVEPVFNTKPKVASRSGSAEPSLSHRLPYPLVPTPSRIPSSIPEDEEHSLQVRPSTSPPAPLHPTPAKGESAMPPSTSALAKSTLRQGSSSSKIPRLKPYSRPAPTMNINKSRLPMRQLDIPAISVGPSIFYCFLRLTLYLSRYRSLH